MPLVCTNCGDQWFPEHVCAVTVVEAPLVIKRDGIELAVVADLAAAVA